jgi:hypothetical protein
MPDRSENIVAADHTFPCSDEEFQEVEDLRFDRNKIVSAAQLAPVGIERKIVETIEQNRPRWPCLLSARA